MSFDFSRQARRLALAGAMAVAIAAPACAGTLIYTPTNPSFGGNPLNGSTLLSEAQAQNQHVPSNGSSGSNAPLTQGQIFAQQLQSQLFASLANNITSAIFGPTAQKNGTFSFGGTTITFTNDGTNIHITINDGTTITNVTVPANAFGSQAPSSQASN